MRLLLLLRLFHHATDSVGDFCMRTVSAVSTLVTAATARTVDLEQKTDHKLKGKKAKASKKKSKKKPKKAK